MSRYKPKSLRFLDESPCILSIYVAEPKREQTRLQERGILKTSASVDTNSYSGYGEEEKECNEEGTDLEEEGMDLEVNKTLCV
jgi:hypothetical protein